ncbi:DUF167 family protein [uncultured Thermanaerothrix sp.]|uniref:DUF167 domain-containing protein n=1 Tax=uncultured Thermanaerothrix sp. TaxID=1195149 RepID=UPI00262E6D21|nr:DUF167 family protein [uncultured Thermanaerothrix sp.]
MGRATKPRFTQSKGGAALSILVRSGAPQGCIECITEDGVVIVGLPATEDKPEQINGALLALLEKVLGVKRSQLEIVAGEESAQKLVAVIGPSPEIVDQALRKASKTA